MNLLAREFPASTFAGQDIADDAIESANAEAQRMGLSNAAFDVADAAKLADRPSSISSPHSMPFTTRWRPTPC